MTSIIFATAPTIERLEKLINEFYYSTTCYVKDGNVYNSKGIIENVEVVQAKSKNQRFVFRLKP